MASPPAAVTLSPDGTKFVTKGGVGNIFSGNFSFWLRLKGKSGFAAYSTSDDVVKAWDGKGKVAIVTGAAGGLGFETARALASKGAHVIVTARDLPKAQAAVAKLQALVPGGQLLPMALDLSSQASIKEFVKNFLALKKPLHILLNNAGVMAIPKLTPTVDGSEMQLGTNHFGHYTLTLLLLPLIVQTAKAEKSEGRIVTTASSMHFLPYKGGILLDGYNDPKKYQAWPAYGQSKLANVLFARLLALKLSEKGLPVASYTLHPGGIHTDLQRDVPAIAALLMQTLLRPMMKSIPQGAATQLLAATAAPGSIPSGEFLQDVNIGASSPLAHDVKLAQGLWDLSEKVTGVKFEF